LYNEKWQSGGCPLQEYRYNKVGVRMEELKYELLMEVNGRMQADLIQSYLEAEGIKVELFQEAVGHHIYPVMIDGLARVQIFVPKEQTADAHKLLESFYQTKSKSEEDE
jgi:hypothetical protein